MRDAGWNLEGETATPVMQLKLWMYLITTDTSGSLHPFSTTRFFFVFFLFSFIFSLFHWINKVFISLHDTLHFHSRGLCAGEGLGGYSRWDFSFEVLPQRQ